MSGPAVNASVTGSHHAVASKAVRTVPDEMSPRHAHRPTTNDVHEIVGLLKVRASGSFPAQHYSEECQFMLPIQGIPGFLSSTLLLIPSLLTQWIPQVKTSMLAIGACERIRKLSRAHPHEVCQSAILPELVKILHDGPLMPLAAAVLSALSTLALDPEGRQSIVLLGGAVPIIK